MNVRTRAEFGMVAVYTFALPFALLASLPAQVVTRAAAPWLDVRTPAGTLAMGVILFLAGAWCFMLVRCVAGSVVAGAQLARWSLRQAPLVCCGAVAMVGALTGDVDFMLLVWGFVAGEWFAHRALARGQDMERMLGGFFLWIGTGLVSLGLAGGIAGLREGPPPDPRALARATCMDGYARALTRSDTAAVDPWINSMVRHPGAMTCAELRAWEPRR
jgi:hypothetical protein